MVVLMSTAPSTTPTTPKSKEAFMVRVRVVRVPVPVPVHALVRTRESRIVYGHGLPTVRQAAAASLGALFSAE